MTCLFFSIYLFLKNFVNSLLFYFQELCFAYSYFVLLFVISLKKKKNLPSLLFFSLLFHLSSFLVKYALFYFNIIGFLLQFCNTFYLLYVTFLLHFVVLFVIVCNIFVTAQFLAFVININNIYVSILNVINDYFFKFEIC